MSVIKPEHLEEIVRRILVKAGTPEDSAKIVADHLVRAHLYGHDSHGVIRLRPYLRGIKNGSLRPDAHITVLRETPSIAVVDGNDGFGQVTAKEAMMLAIEKAKKTGIGFVTLTRPGHLGRVGEFVEIAAQRDCIGFAIVNSGLSQAPWGSIDPAYGTNPIAVCIPAGKHRNILYDAATSVVAAGKISVASAAGKPVPEGWIIDYDGNPTTNPDDFRPPLRKMRSETGIRTGALLPFGGYKGSGLALVVEALCACFAAEGVTDEAVVAGSLAGKAVSRPSGALLAAVNIRTFRDLEAFKHSIDNLIDLVKESRKAKGVTEYVFDKERGYVVDGKRAKKVVEVLIAGDKEYKTEALMRKVGIYVEEDTWEAIQEDARELRVDISDVVQ